MSTQDAEFPPQLFVGNRLATPRHRHTSGRESRLVLEPSERASRNPAPAPSPRAPGPGPRRFRGGQRLRLIDTEARSVESFRLLDGSWLRIGLFADADARVPPFDAIALDVPALFKFPNEP